jgi:zinc/manganese transport system permease protein
MSAGGDLLWLGAPVLALLASCLLLVPLGSQVLTRGVVFIDLAVAQVAAIGVLVAGMLYEGKPGSLTELAAAGAALLGSSIVWWLARRWPEQREALIGLVYVAAASASVVVVTFDPHGRERLGALLAADVLWVPWRSVALLCAIAVIVSGMAVSRKKVLAQDAVFYPTFAIALSIAVQSLGLYLVFALLIGPALWAHKRLSLGGAIAAALTACAAGLALSWAFDWPSGASTAMALSVLGILRGLAHRS